MGEKSSLDKRPHHHLRQSRHAKHECKLAGGAEGHRRVVEKGDGENQVDITVRNVGTQRRRAQPVEEAGKRRDNSRYKADWTIR